MTVSGLSSRKFTLEDQIEFVEISGDWNPVHVNPIAARRTIYGGVVVHGIHSLLEDRGGCHLLMACKRGRGIVLRRSVCPYFYCKIIRSFIKLSDKILRDFIKNGKIAKKWERMRLTSGDRYRSASDFPDDFSVSNFYDRVEATCGSLSREALLIRFQPPEGSGSRTAVVSRVALFRSFAFACSEQ